MEIQKEYGLPEEKLIALAKRYSALLSRFLKPLSSLNGNLSQEFLDSFAEDLILLDTIPDGKASNEMLKEKKQDVEDVKVECIKYFKKVHYFVFEAFPENTEIVDLFGFNDLSSNMKTSSGLISYLTEFELNCLVYFEELEDAGFTKDYLHEVKRLRDKLLQSVSELLKLRKDPKKYAQMRTSILNRIWQKIKSIHRAASLVFDADNKTLNEFKIPETTLSRFSKKLLSFFHISFSSYSY